MRISDWRSDVCSSDLRVLGDDPEQWIIQCDEHAAFAGNNYLPFMLKPYGDKRALLYQCLDVLELQSSSQDDTLVRAIACIREWPPDRKRVVQGRSVSLRVDPGGRRISKQKTTITS